MRPAQLESRCTKIWEEDNVKKSLLVIGVAVVVMMAWSIGRVQGEQSKGQVIFVSPDQVSFHDNGNGVSMVKIWGDPDKEAHATYTKFKPGYDAGTHTHTNDVWIVGIKGAYLYKDEAGDKRVGPGDFLRVPGGKKHWSGGDKTEGAIFYEESSGKFDLIPAK
ncbi:MAG: hypothetical protein DMG68_01120 [Acidobacteria bacterium]|nr:MAG: hypothetical protein DMG68_01120 [Acidobacteriota bacterium]